MRSLRQKLADLSSTGAGLRRDPVRTTTGSRPAIPAMDRRLAADGPAPDHEAENDMDRRLAADGPAPDHEAESDMDRRLAADGPAQDDEAESDMDRRLAADGPAPGRRDPRGAAATSKPSLEELRARIAALVGHRDPPRPRPDPSAGELPFFVERTASGPLYVRRVRAAPAGRVGRAPLVAARDADPVTLGLLALDPALSTCDPRRALYLDTETTGLAGGTGTVAFLVGLAFFDEAHQTFVLEQLLLRRLGEEAPILELLERRLADASMIVTYNGKSFDVPLLRTRFVMNRMKRPAEPPHLDLLHVARRVHRHRLTTCTLSSIESEVLGRERVGDISGMDIVEAYAHFLRTGDDGALHGVVTHNEHDVLAMVALLGLYGEPFGTLDPVEGDIGTGLRRPSPASAAPESEPPVRQPAPSGLEVDFDTGVRRASTPRLDADFDTGVRRAVTVGLDVDFDTGVRPTANRPCGLGAGLAAADLAGVARTLQRAGALSRAGALAGEAVRAGGGVLARRVSADIHRARGDTAAALREYEAILVEVSDPEVRLVLAKLYEHRERAFERALAVLEGGTTETDEATTRRRARLERKVASASSRRPAKARRPAKP